MTSEKDKKVWSDSKADSIWQTSSFHLWTGCKQVCITSDSSTIVNQQASQLAQFWVIDHKRVKDALASLLSLEA
ncbi:hypothetical protein CRYUN_Cryun25bG0015800 [Craigia yunnanensis]